MAKRMSVSRGIKQTGRVGGDTDLFFSEFETKAIVIGGLLALAFIVATVFVICKLFLNKKKSTGAMTLKNSFNTMGFGKQTTLCSLAGNSNKVTPLKNTQFKRRKIAQQNHESINVKPYTSSVEETLHKLGFKTTSTSKEEDPLKKKQDSDTAPREDILGSLDDQKSNVNKSQTEFNALVSSIEDLETTTNIDQAILNRERTYTTNGNSVNTSHKLNRSDLAPQENVRLSRSRGSMFNNFFAKDCPVFEDKTIEQKSNFDKTETIPQIGDLNTELVKLGPTDADTTPLDDHEYENDGGGSEKTEKDPVNGAEFAKSMGNVNSDYDQSKDKQTTTENEPKNQSRDSLYS